MAKGQMRSTREKKKPKQDKNEKKKKKKKGASPFTGYAEKGKPGQGSVPKKTP